MIASPRPQSDIYARKVLTFGTAWLWAKEHADSRQEKLLLAYFLDRTMRLPHSDRPLPEWTDALQRRIRLLGLLPRYPSLALRWEYWRRVIPGTRTISGALTGEPQREASGS